MLIKINIHDKVHTCIQVTTKFYKLLWICVFKKADRGRLRSSNTFGCSTWRLHIYTRRHVDKTEKTQDRKAIGPSWYPSKGATRALRSYTHVPLYIIFRRLLDDGVLQQYEDTSCISNLQTGNRHSPAKSSESKYQLLVKWRNRLCRTTKWNTCIEITFLQMTKMGSSALGRPCITQLLETIEERTGISRCWRREYRHGLPKSFRHRASPNWRASPELLVKTCKNHSCKN